MPTFETPHEISVVVDVVVAEVVITASDRATTNVEVKPTNENDDHDIRSAANTRIEYAEEIGRAHV